MKNYGIYLQTSLQEGCGTIMPEVKVFNRPVVATNLIKDKEGCLYDWVKKMFEDFRRLCIKAFFAKEPSGEIDKLFAQ